MTQPISIDPPAGAQTEDAADDVYVFPASYAQQRLWFMHQLDPNSAVYHLPNALRLVGALDIAALAYGFDVVVGRHEVLRTSFLMLDGAVCQVVAPRMRLALPVLDLRALPERLREATAARLANAEAQRAFDLARGPLMRATLLRLGEAEHGLLVTMHHIISDARSMEILTAELTACYDARTRGAPAALPDLPVQYADYAIWQAAWLDGEGDHMGSPLQTQVAYWQGQLAGLPTLELPTDYPPPSVATFRGAVQDFTLAPELQTRAFALGQAQRVTPFMLMLAAFDVLLARYSGRHDIAVGTPVTNRTRAETEHLIGFFVNTLVLRADLSGDPSFRELLRRVREVCLGAYAHQDLPFERIVEALQIERDLSHNPLFQVIFALDHAPPGAAALPDILLEPLAVDQRTVPFTLGLRLSETPSGLAGALEYSTDLFTAPTIRRMIGHFRTLLAEALAQPDRPLSRLSLLTPAERQQLLVDWNDNGAGIRGQGSGVGGRGEAGLAATSLLASEAGCLDQLFEAQVARTPDAVVAVFESRHLTYGELNARANRLAHHLQRLGVAPEVLVAICMERSLEFLVGLLGVLKAGGAYVPLDPAYPAERISFMLEDSRARVLVTKDQRPTTNDERQDDRRPTIDDKMPSELSSIVHRPSTSNNEGSDSSFVLRPSSFVNVHTVDLVADWPRIAQESAENPASTVRSDNLAYVIYTSGSTGRPKGVLIAHRGLGNLARIQAELFGLGPHSRILQLVSFSFDASVWDMLMVLPTGATLQIATEEDRLPGPALARLLRERAITVATLTPSLLAILANEEYPTLQTIISTGESCTIDVIRRWAPGRRFFNGYGPTEVTIGLTCGECHPSDQRSLIGRSFLNMQAYMCDRHGRPAPIGVPGELYIGGVGLARGYLNRPDLTAERFVPNPFAEVSGIRYWVLGAEPSDTRYPTPDTRLYRTGDLARYMPDGTMEFVGRADQQVKLRGFRIELGEIVAALRSHPAVREALVVMREDTPGQKRLVAYVVPTNDQRPTTNDQRPSLEDRELKIEDSNTSTSAALSSILYPLSSDLREFLATRLPAYMIPSAFVALGALPLTANGKVDQRALPVPQPDADRDYIAPRGAVEELLAAIWSDVLALKRVSAEENFFALGGHSLLATQVIARVRGAFDVELPLRSLFETPTIAGLAGQIARARRAQPDGSAPPLRPVGRDGPLPLSFAQQRLWFLDQLQPGSAAYTLPIALHLSGALDLAALARSLLAIIRRHEVLRTTFALVDGQPVQRIALPGTGALAAPRIPLIDLQALPAETRAALARRLATAEARRPFDLAAGPLFRIAVLRAGAHEHVLVSAMHHIVADAWSSDVLVRELTALYRAALTSQAARLPDLPIQYADYAAWQRDWLRGSVREAQLAYWTARLRDTPTLQLPADRPRPPEATFAGAQRPFALPPGLSAELRALSRRAGATLFMTLLGAWQVLLARYSGQDDILVGTPIANRTRAEIEHLIGFFLNTLVLRTDLRGNPTFLELMQRVRAGALDAYDHQELPFEQIVEALQPARDLSRHPLFQVLFVLQHAPAVTMALPGLTLRALDVERGTVQFDLVLSLQESEAGLDGVLDYSTDLFDQTTIVRMIAHLTTLLGGAVADPGCRLADLPLLNRAERHQLLVDWNSLGDRGQGTGDRSIQGLFAAQAARAPDAIALSFDAPSMLDEGRTTKDEHCDSSFVLGRSSFVTHLTYAELNARSNQLAHHLRTLGVGPDVLVGIYLERSPELIIAILGVLKAGGAYLPLDPALPIERTSFMLADSQTRVLITTKDNGQATNDERCPEGAQTNEPTTADCRLPTDETGHLVTLPPCHLVNLEIDWPLIAREPAEEPPNQANAENLAYVIYTSGSTGTPKGVLAHQRGLVNFADALAERIGLGPAQRFLEFAPFSFDASALQVFPTLISGATLVLHPDPTRLTSQELAALCARQQVTILDLPAALWRQWISDLAALRAGLPAAVEVFLTGGERVPAEHLRAWAGMTRRPARLLSSYGPTEATVTTALYATSSAAVGRLSQPALPMGRGLPGARIYLLDRAMRPVPIGVPGEVYIGGAGVTRGYLSRPDLTAAAFVPNPFARVSGVRCRVSEEATPNTWHLIPDTRLYRTGDLARYLPDGSLEFVGRADQQIKLRGYRVEPGEVEALLARHPSVRAAVVVVREDQPGDARLVGYVVPASDEGRMTEDEGRTTNDDGRTTTDDGRWTVDDKSNAEPSSIVYRLSSLANELRDFLQERLPDYMVPSAIVPLAALPLTRSGKLDRRALPAPGPALRASQRAYLPPRDSVELQLAQLWEDLLAVRPIGIADDFFELGGHSLLAVRLMAHVQQQFGRGLPLAILFQEPTIARLAAHLRQDRAPQPWSPLVPIRRGGGRPFFCVHPAGGNVLCYALLARHLAADQPLYGLQARGLDEDQEPLDRVEEIAARYVAALREQQPDGPYLLGGWSGGGVVAFEMAQQLRRQGQEVALLALLDSAAPQPDGDAGEPDDAELIAGMLGPEHMPLPLEEFQRLAPDRQVDILLEAAKQAGMLPPDAGPQQIRRLLKVFKANTRAIELYQPRIYAGRITLFRSASGADAPGAEQPPAAREADPTLGWGDRSAQPVALHRVPGSHATMLDDPHVRTLAEQLQSCIDESGVSDDSHPSSVLQY